MDKKYSIEFSRLNFETLNDLVKKKKVINNLTLDQVNFRENNFICFPGYLSNIVLFYVGI